MTYGRTISEQDAEILRGCEKLLAYNIIQGFDELEKYVTPDEEGRFGPSTVEKEATIRILIGWATRKETFQNGAPTDPYNSLWKGVQYMSNLDADYFYDKVQPLVEAAKKRIKEEVRNRRLKKEGLNGNGKQADTVEKNRRRRAKQKSYSIMRDL